MFQWLKRQLDKLVSPTLDWIQVEVTTHCNAACIYCPHTLLRDRWTSKRMPMSLFRKLIPFLKYTDMVYLQGWGEPLLNNDIFEMIRICKNHGKRVGFTTNGMLLAEDAIRTLVDLDLDIIGISLAGVTAATHNQIRKGTDFNKLVDNLELLRAIKAETKTRSPQVHLAYLMLRSNFHELKEIIALAKKTEAQQVVASNLTLIVDPKLSAEAIFNDTGRTDYYGITLEKIKNKAARENIIFDYHGPGLDNASLCCRENVRYACVINVEGEVVPCVLADPVLCKRLKPGDDTVPSYIFKGQSYSLSGLSFGNIQTESLTRIWNKKDYTAFRGLFNPKTTNKPEQILSEMPKCCVACYKRLGA
jgi:MoaA/NifB/PqqE/SkfB family radical SAM enzyme